MFSKCYTVTHFPFCPFFYFFVFLAQESCMLHRVGQLISSIGDHTEVLALRVQKVLSKPVPLTWFCNVLHPWHKHFCTLNTSTTVWQYVTGVENKWKCIFTLSHVHVTVYIFSMLLWLILHAYLWLFKQWLSQNQIVLPR